MSEETTAFVAEIYVNGVNAGHAKNDGHGGSTFYHAHEGHRNLIEKAEQHCRALPLQKFGGIEHPMNLVDFIDNLVFAEMKKKDEKKFQNKMANTIMWGVPNGMSYTQVKFKTPFTTAHASQLQKYIDEKVKPTLKAGEVILNTNLQQLGVTI